MTASALATGFAQAPIESAHAFRAALTALSRPGTDVALQGAQPPLPLSVAAGVLVLTLVDGTTPLHLAGAHDTPAIRSWIGFHTSARFVSAEMAVFALGSWAALHPLDRFAIGTPEYPDRAATLIVEGSYTQPARLSGPGIQATADVLLPEVAAFAANHARYPLGWDAFFTNADHLIGLPRSTDVRAR